MTMALCALLAVSAPAQGATTTAGLSKACAAKDGTLRLRAKRAKCRKGEKAISLWVGGAPAGAKGAPGAAGEPGAAGPAGATGASGSPDTDQQVLAKLLGVDGSGSGLDADLFDGLSASSFQRRGTTTSCTAGQVVTGVGSNGDVTCAADKDTRYSAGTGIALSSGPTINVDTVYLDDRYRPRCPALSHVYSATDYQTRWTGTVCIMPSADTFAATWYAQVGNCSNGLYGPRGRIATLVELVGAAKLGQTTLSAGEWTADSAGDDQSVFINAPANPNNPDGVQARTVTGGVTCVFAPLAPALATP